MGKEHLPDLENKSEANLRIMLEQAEFNQDYRLQLHICRALLPFEERPCLALTAIKELEELINTELNLEENRI